MDKKSIKGTETEKKPSEVILPENPRPAADIQYLPKWHRKKATEQIAAIFLETASREYAHAKKFFSYLEEGMLEITASYPAGPVGTTAQNLQEAAAGEA